MSLEKKKYRIDQSGNQDLAMHQDHSLDTQGHGGWSMSARQ
jgi:hypothetical protein